ncbi:MAG: alkaline phosphatase family protein [Anaerolineales bacterium]|nr:alkaline phosphatase family protein [Anaerolineales bacterium]MCB8939317.1 alkaline phosphatase family protein [Ardenticatenaceae bacterium]
MSSKLLVIGLDGGTFDLLLPLVKQGIMPHFGRFLQAGSWGRLASTVPPFTAVAWSSFATGKNPGKHGVLSFERSEKFHYHEKIVGFNDARRLERPLWDILSEAGKRVAVINVPLSYPPRPVNGLMITGMMTPATAREFTFPPAFAEQLAGYRIDVDFVREGDSFRRYGLPPKEEMLADIQAVTRQRTAVCQRLLEQEAWDFFMVVYTGTDRISHFFWDDLEPLWGERPFANPPSSNFSKLLDYFQQLDNDIAQLVKQAGPEAHLLFMSDHGFGTAPTKRFAVNLWLEQQQLLTAQVPNRIGGLAYWRMKIGRSAVLKQLARRFIPQQAQDRLAQKATEAAGGSDIAWAKSQAYFVPVYFNVCGIELNQVGQHREGVVAPGPAYEAVRDKIIAAAGKLVDPETGEPIVELVARREDLFEGPFVEQFPDIILVLKPEYVGGQSLAASQLIEPHVPFRSGEHRPDGIFAAVGPKIHQLADLPDLHLMDVSATALYLLDVPVPDDFDGRILEEAIDPAHWHRYPAQYQEGQVKAASGTVESMYSKDEEAEIIERLRSLGYME